MKKHMSLMLVANAIVAMLSVSVVDSFGQGNLDKEFKEAMEAARKILKEPIGTPPVPPDINLKCSEGVALERLGGVYYTTLVQPEDAICRRLLSAARQVQLSGLEDKDGKVEDAMITAGLVFARNFKKANALFKAYKPKPEKLGAVGLASLRICKNAQLLGVAEDHLAEYASVIGAWANTVAENYLKELRKSHDYKVITAFVELKRMVQMLGANVSEASGLADLAATLVFKADFDVSCWVSTGSQRMTLKGTAKLTPDVHMTSFDGEGRGEYVSYTHAPTKAKTTLEIAKNRYSVRMRLVDFKPCDGTVRLLVDKIGAENEYWYNPASGDRYTAPSKDFDLFVKTVVDQLFQEYRLEGGFGFTMPIQNLQAEMCNGNFTQTGTTKIADGSTSASITYNVTITHTPK